MQVSGLDTQCAWIYHGMRFLVLSPTFFTVAAHRVHFPEVKAQNIGNKLKFFIGNFEN